MRSLHVIFFLSPLSLVAADGCFANDPFGANCGVSPSAIAVDGAQAICNFVLTDCPGGFPSAEVCVTKWCEAGCADPRNCCASSDPTSCFQTSSGIPNSSGDGSPSQVQGPGFAECSSIVDALDSCKSATPEFTTLPSTAQASCFCFNKDGSYNGTAWDYAASTCYAAMATQTSYPGSELSVYSADVVGACTKFVDAGIASKSAILSKVGVSKGGAVATAAPAGSAAPSSSSTATDTSSASPEPTEATTSPTTSTVFVSTVESGANKGLEGRGLLLGAVLSVSCLFASL